MAIHLFTISAKLFAVTTSVPLDFFKFKVVSSPIEKAFFFKEKRSCIPETKCSELETTVLSDLMN